MSTNLYRRLRGLFPDAPLQVGDVISVSNGTAVIELPGGARVNARGTATAGQRVFFRDGVIEGQAPDLTLVEIEV